MAKQAQQTQSDVRKLSSLSTSNRETKKGQSIFLAGKHGAGGGSRTPTRVTPRQILSLGEHQVKSYEKLTKPWGSAGFHQTK